MDLSLLRVIEGISLSIVEWFEDEGRDTFPSSFSSVDAAVNAVLDVVVDVWLTIVKLGECRV